jgi:type IV pilus assembly protein PilM
MGKTVVGVDIGVSSIRAVEVSNYGGVKPAIVRMAEQPLPENAVRRGEVMEPGTVSTALKRLWSTGGFKSKDVVLGIGGQRVFAREVSLPRAPIAQLRESLPFQVQELLPVPVSDVFMDFYATHEEDGEQGPQVAGLLVAGLRDSINTKVDAAMRAGLRPVHVDLVPFALSRAILPYRSARGCDVIVAIGAATTHVVVVDNGIPQFVRMIAAGGDDITQGLATRLQWTPLDAERAKRAIGMGSSLMRAEDRPALEVIYEFAGELLANIRSTINYYTSAHAADPVQRILLTGGGGDLSGLASALGELTQLPVTKTDPLAGFTAPRGRRDGARREDLDAYTTAFGLALGGHE